MQKMLPLKPAVQDVMVAVADLRLAGCTYREIAEALGISKTTARAYVRKAGLFSTQPESIQGADGKWRPPTSNRG